MNFLAISAQANALFKPTVFNAYAKAIQLNQIRNSASFFNRHSAKHIWKSVTSVSNVGRKRGRGKGTGSKRATDLNKGQIIGIGSKPVVWPGLNTQIIRGRDVTPFQVLKSDQAINENFKKMRTEMQSPKYMKVHPLHRGWSGKSLGGRLIGQPDSYNGIHFDGFSTRLIGLHGLITMRKNLGRARSTKALAVTGNKNGLIGFMTCKSKEMRAAIKGARNRASLRLRYIKMDGGSIVHDFHSTFGRSTVFAYKMPPGFGVVAHRVIRAICEVAGITDIYVKVASASTKNYLNITRAFVLGLASQKSFQEIADEKKLNLVELKPENDFLPRIVARPADGKVRTKEDIATDEIMEFRQYVQDGRIRELKYKSPPFYTRSIGYANYLKAHHYARSRLGVRVYLKAKYGKVESFLNVREREERQARLASVKQEEN